MKKEFYKLKKSIRWRGEGKLLLFFHPQEKRLLIFNKEVARNVSVNGTIELNDGSSNFVNFLKKINAVNKISKPTNVKIDTKSLKNISAPLNVTIQITNRCNLNCIHCHNNKQELCKTLPIAKYKMLIKELAELKVFNVNISGGEPLLVDDIANIIKHAVNNGMSCTMSTNLTLLNEKMAIKLAKAGLKKIHISLDSFDPLAHDRIRGVDKSFERMKKNLRFLKENNIQYTMVTTLVDQSPNHYAKTIDLAYQLGASAHKTNTVVPQGKSKLLEIGYNGSGRYGIKEYIEVWKNKKSQYLGKMGILAETMFSIQIGEEMITDDNVPEILRVGCPAGILTCAINESGDVTPCSFFTGLAMGNIFKNKFVNIWNNNSMRIFRKRNNIAVCGSCQYRDNCGGCRARSYGQTGSMNREDPYCFMNIN